MFDGGAGGMRLRSPLKLGWPGALKKRPWVGVTSVGHASDAKVVTHSLNRDVLVVSSAAVVSVIAMFGVGMGVTARLCIDVVG